MSPPEKPTYDDRVLTQYLLGALPEADTERLDELSISDDEIAARLRTAENDLVDAHACGELEGDALERFRTHYLSSPRRREKARFAEAFRAFAGQTGIPARPQPARAWPPWLAAAACLAIAASGYLAFENYRLGRDLSRSAADRMELLRRERELEAQAGQGPKTPATASIFSFVLLPATRGAGGLTPVILSPEAEFADFELRLEADDFPQYHVDIKDPGTGRVLWKSDPLRSVGRLGAKAVLVRAPANVFHPGHYILELSGVPSGILAGYPIQVEIR